MQEDQTEALNEQVVDETTTQESPAEENQTTDQETEVSTPEPVVAPKKGAQSRIRELSGEVHSLKERIAELTNPGGFSAPQAPYTPQEVATSEDGSIDPQEFKRQVLNEANQLIDFKTRQAAVIQRINRETEEVVSKYAELDPESDSFDKELSDAVYEAVEAKVKADPTASVKEFVNKQMKLYKREASREEAQTKATVTKQAAQAAIRPTQTKPVDTKFEDLSIEEMRAKLGYAS